VIAAALALLVAQTLAAPPPMAPQAQPLGNAQIDYDYRCKSCHEPAQPGAPDRAALARLPAAAIVRSLETGKMKAMGSTLTADEKKAIAAFIVGAR
jgi:polyvinyl alcohol dehydrogenase (cytochrome)